MKSSKMKDIILRNSQKFYKVTISLFIFYTFGYIFCQVYSICIVLMTPVGQQMTDASSAEQAFMFLNTLIYQNFIVGFILLLIMIYVLLETINEFLDSFINENVPELELIESLRTVKLILDKICDALENLRGCYAMNTVAYLIYSIFFNISSLCGIISFFSSGSKEEDFVFYVLSPMWTLYNFVLVSAIIGTSAWIEKEGRRVEAKVFKFLHMFPSTKVCAGVLTLSMQLSHRQTSFSCGLFSVDWYLVFHVVGLTFSYMLIFLQFEYM